MTRRSSHGLDTLPDALDWRLRAKCRDEDLTLFFPDRAPAGSRIGLDPYQAPDLYAAARRVCTGCPTRRECLDLVVGLPDTNDQHGMFGGYSPTERRQIRQCRRGDCEHDSHRGPR